MFVLLNHIYIEIKSLLHIILYLINREEIKFHNKCHQTIPKL